MKKTLTKFLILIFILQLLPVNTLSAATISSRLKGRILLQVELKGEAWYVNPDNEKRYFLGKPTDAFNVMRDLGLGISNKDFTSYKGYAPKKLSGKILLKIEDSGKAYYVNPVDLKMHYLGRPSDAFNIMRDLGLGIANIDLANIEIYVKSNNNNGSAEDSKNDSDDDGVPDIYDMHPKEKSIISNKVYKFESTGTPFLSDLKKGENSIQVPIPRDRYMMYAEYFPHEFNDDYSNIVNFITPDDPVIWYLSYQLNLYAEKFNEDFTQLAIDFVQQLHYNNDWITRKDEYPKYPIETLMDGSGDCEDLSILLASILQSWRKENGEINFSLILFKDHVAVGYSLKFLDEMSEEKLNNFFTELDLPYSTNFYLKNHHRYLYIETTNDDFEIGEAPDDLKGVSATIYELGNMKNAIVTQTPIIF